MNIMQSSANALSLSETPEPNNMTQNQDAHEAMAISGILSHNASTDREPAEYHQLAGELRNAVATAQSAARAKAEIIASISQEVREPIDIVLKMLDLLNDAIEDPNQLQHIQTATQAGHALLSMINMVCEISPNNIGAVHDRAGDEQRHLSQGGSPKTAKAGGNPDMHTNNRDELDTILSVAALEQLARDTDPEIMPDLIAVFVDDAKQRISRITDAIASRDYQIMAAEAHALGSSAATFGLPGIHTIARECEHMLREKHYDEGTRFAEELVVKAALGLNALRKYTQSLQ